MSEKFRNRYRVESARAPWWDYAWNAAYFITICTRNRKHYFGEIIDGKMELSHVGVIADLMWHEIKNHSKNCQLGQFVVMPDHVHGVLILNGNESTLNKSPMNESRLNESSMNESPIIESPIIESPMIVSLDVETRHALSLHLGIQSDKPFGIQSDESLGKQPGEPNSIDSNMENLSPACTRFQNQGKNTISSIIGSYKSAVTKHAHRLGYEFAWQGRFHDHIIRDEEELQRISNYIQQNVLNWNEGNEVDKYGFE